MHDRCYFAEKHDSWLRTPWLMHRKLTPQTTTGSCLWSRTIDSSLTGAVRFRNDVQLWKKDDDIFSSFTGCFGKTYWILKYCFYVLTIAVADPQFSYAGALRVEGTAWVVFRLSRIFAEFATEASALINLIDQKCTVSSFTFRPFFNRAR